MILLEFNGGWGIVILGSLMAFPIVGIPASIILYFLKKNETNKILGNIWIALFVICIFFSIIGLYFLAKFTR